MVADRLQYARLNTLEEQRWIMNVHDLFQQEVSMADKKTSDKAASSASKVLQDGRTGKNSKTAAGSALSQKEGSKKKS